MKEEVITALTLVIAGIIFPHIALASIANIIKSPTIRLVLLQLSSAKYEPDAWAE